MGKALIFDFDGTMIDSEWLFFESVNHYLMDHFGYQIPFEEYQKGIGSSAAEGSFYEKLSQAIGKPMNLAELNEWILQDQIRNFASASLRPGILELLDQACQQEWKIGIVSNSELRELNYYFDKHLTVKNKIDVFVTVEELEKGKPDPEGYHLCLERLGVAAEEAIVIEDSPVGAQAAVAAAISTYAYPNVFTKGMSFPDGVKDFERVNEVFL